MSLEKISSGNAKIRAQGYYTAVLTLAEAPTIQLGPDQEGAAQTSPANDQDQPGQPEQQPGQPQQQAGHPQHLGQPQQQPGHPQQQPGPQQIPVQAGVSQKPHDIDQTTDSAQMQQVTRHVIPDANVGPHKEKYRWRLLLFEMLPGTTVRMAWQAMSCFVLAT